MITLNVKQLPDDFWSRPRLENAKTGCIYADVSCGDARYQPRKYNIPGDWHTTTQDGEPEYPLKADIHFEIVK